MSRVHGTDFPWEPTLLDLNRTSIQLTRDPIDHISVLWGAIYVDHHEDRPVMSQLSVLPYQTHSYAEYPWEAEQVIRVFGLHFKQLLFLRIGFLPEPIIVGIFGFLVGHRLTLPQFACGARVGCCSLRWLKCLLRRFYSWRARFRHTVIGPSAGQGQRQQG